MHWKYFSLIPLKKISLLWYICLVNGLETFYIDIKTIELVKKQTMFQKKIEDVNGK